MICRMDKREGVGTDMLQNKIVTDDDLMELAKHGTNSYPFKCYFEKLSQFDFYCIEWHWHTEWEFVYVESGSMTLCVGERVLKLSEGNGIFINSKILHRFYSCDEAVIPNFLCRPSFIAPENSLIYQKYVWPIISSSLSCLLLEDAILWQREALEIMKEIFSAQGRGNGSELVTSALMQKLWLTIFENIDKTFITEQAGGSGAEQARLQLMMQFIHQNYSKDISLEEISRYAKISKSTVRNLFNRFLHIAPINYLISYRLKEAALLLKNTEKKITAVSCETGFRNVDHFCRAFKKNYNMTPTEYRKSKYSAGQ